MVPRKGQDMLIRAWPQVLRSKQPAEPLLLLVGDGPYRPRLDRLAQRPAWPTRCCSPAR